jgi:hypothetical protein
VSYPVGLSKVPLRAPVFSREGLPRTLLDAHYMRTEKHPEVGSGARRRHAMSRWSWCGREGRDPPYSDLLG